MLQKRPIFLSRLAICKPIFLSRVAISKPIFLFLVARGHVMMRFMRVELCFINDDMLKVLSWVNCFIMDGWYCTCSTHVLMVSTFSLDGIHGDLECMPLQRCFLVALG